jgi:hypothetical protein
MVPQPMGSAHGRDPWAPLGTPSAASEGQMKRWRCPKRRVTVPQRSFALLIGCFGAPSGTKKLCRVPMMVPLAPPVRPAGSPTTPQIPEASACRG